ncbi:cupin domain-containing protein [Mesobacterium sp. TK19101]|uniref:Cupin domain-containing protein n=1 Tax=Mesobacterium hydrothermale TaxID=3111907 RepID=A0ABU6HBY2_9RHOB|nr:cupin domain-containing protein [Mesobacterium sp. TK19101]MEC3859968.1 cupin domain-containing protein [Mesobacterium sp. TK19101]
MPKITEDTVRRDSDNGVCGPFEALLFSDTGGLTQFGAFVEILAPGSRSSIKHWHTDEDEMVFVLAGTVTLIEGDSETVLSQGDAATFKAGDALGHCLENRTDAPVRYLVIGTRAARDTVTYPDHARVLQVDRERDARIWTDFDGHPAASPYG